MKKLILLASIVVAVVVLGQALPPSGGGGSGGSGGGTSGTNYWVDAGTGKIQYTGKAQANGAANSLQIQGSTTGNPVQVNAIGADTDIGILFEPQGVGNVYFDAPALEGAGAILGQYDDGPNGGSPVFGTMVGSSSIVFLCLDYPGCTARLTGDGTLLWTNENILHTGAHQSGYAFGFNSNRNSTIAKFQLDGGNVVTIDGASNIGSLAVAGAGNNMTLNAVAAGSPVNLTVGGTDTSVGLDVYPKGDALIRFMNTTDAGVRWSFGDAGMIFPDGTRQSTAVHPLSAGTNITLYDDGGTTRVTASGGAQTLVGASYYQHVAQTITSQAATVWHPETLVYDTGSHVTNPTTTSWTYTVGAGEAGYYLVHGNSILNQGANGYNFVDNAMYILVNGTITTVGAQPIFPANSISVGVDSGAQVLHLAVGDTIQIQIRFDAGNNSRTVTTSIDYYYINISRIGT